MSAPSLNALAERPLLSRPQTDHRPILVNPHRRHHHWRHDTAAVHEHLGAGPEPLVGKISFDAPKLVDNIQAFLDKVSTLKPGSVKGTFIKGAHISATMSPSVRLAV